MKKSLLKLVSLFAFFGSILVSCNSEPSLSPNQCSNCRYEFSSKFLASKCARKNGCPMFVDIPVVKIDSNEFVGSDTEGCFVAERQIKINSYYIAKYEITKKIYSKIMGDTELNTTGTSADPSYTYTESFPPLDNEDGDLRPVENMSWMDACNFCNILSELQGLEPVYNISNIKTQTVSGGGKYYTYISSANVTWNQNANGWRLPTEVEWEYAARGADPEGSTWNYRYAGMDSTSKKPSSGNWADTVLDSIAWYCCNLLGGESTTSKYPDYYNKEKGSGAHQVGLRAPNTIGLYDMTGNVAEFCWDWTGRKITKDTPLIGGEKLTSDGKCYRGGDWYHDAAYCAIKYRDNPTYSRFGIGGVNDKEAGFRLVRNAE